MSEIQGKPVYGVCACKEKVQVLSVDQVVDLIQQMAANDWQVPADYIPKTSVNGIVEQKSGDEIKLWIGKQAEYDALTDEEKSHKFAIITDDPTLNEITNLLNQYRQSIENINNNITKMIDGDLQVGQAGNAKTVNNIEITKDSNGVLKIGDVVIPQRIKINFSVSGNNIYVPNVSTTDTIEICYSLNANEDQIQYYKGVQFFNLWSYNASGDTSAYLYMEKDNYIYIGRVGAAATLSIKSITKIIE